MKELFYFLPKPMVNIIGENFVVQDICLITDE